MQFQEWTGVPAGGMLLRDTVVCRPCPRVSEGRASTKAHPLGEAGAFARLHCMLASIHTCFLARHGCSNDRHEQVLGTGPDFCLLAGQQPLKKASARQ